MPSDSRTASEAPPTSRLPEDSTTVRAMHVRDCTSGRASPGQGVEESLRPVVPLEQSQVAPPVSGVGNGSLPGSPSVFSSQPRHLPERVRAPTASPSAARP